MAQNALTSLQQIAAEATAVQWLVAVATAALLYTTTSVVYLLNFHPAAKFPGPKLAAISNIPYAYHWLRGRWPWAVESMMQQYGKVVRVAPNEIAFKGPQAFNDILGASAKGYETFVKTDLMDFGAGDRGFIWEADPVKRKEVAKRLLPAFGPKATKAKEPTLHVYIDLFVEKMKKLGSQGGGIDIRKWTTWFAADLSAELAYNRELNHMKNESSSEFLDTLLGTSIYGTISQVPKKIPAISTISLFFVSPSVLRSLPKVFKMNSEEVQRRIDTRGNTRHPDFVDYMLPADAPPPSTKKEKVHLEQVALQLFVAGYDPVQITLNSVFFYLIKEADMYKNLVKEIRDAFEIQEDITADALVELRYLQAVLYEVLRIQVTNGTGMPRISPGAVVDGVYVPKGVVCQTSPFATGRSPEYFRDPLEFHAERWLPRNHPKYSDRYRDDNLKSIYPFGVGIRMCTGREIAWQQVKTFLAKVLWTFDLEGIKGMDKEFDRDFSLHAMWNRPEIRVKFHPVSRK